MQKKFCTLASRGRFDATGSKWLLGIALSAWLGIFSVPRPANAAEPLTLQIAREGEVLRLTAPPGATNLILECTSNLLAGSWTPFAPSLDESNTVLLPDFTTGARFFRLRGGDSDPLPPTNSIPGMLFIPAGPFQMGDPFNEGLLDEVPVHTVFVSAFYIDPYAMRKDLWDSVRAWGLAHGYYFDHRGLAKGTNHPVQKVSWYDVVKWCNARSEQEGLTPVYYKNAAQTNVYRTGRLDLNASAVNWSANGYRLPTEAEWEKAARGGLSGQRFPWGNTISHTQANYFSTGLEPYDVSPTRGCNPAFTFELEPYTNPPGSFAPNDYGLYDMAGNVFQWCWDWAKVDWYSRPEAVQPDTKGPATGVHRILRGGAWAYEASRARCARRSQEGPIAAEQWEGLGFRCVRSCR